MSSLPAVGSVMQFRYRFGTAEYDEARCELQVAGTKVAVQRKPLEILGLLLAHAGEVVTKAEIFEIVWADRPTVENVLANAITKLRLALGEGNAAFIVTLPRIGYRFVGSLERVAVGRVLPSMLDLQAGQLVPGRLKFQLEERVGQSASNEVWLARHVKTHERRVFKFCTDHRQLSQLKREFTLSRLLQDNLGERAAAFMRVLDCNFETSPFFLECEYGGQDLLRWSKSDGQLDVMPILERVDLFLQIAQAVAAAHSIGVLHKDLKPANILVMPEGSGWRLRLADFGSSDLLDPQRLARFGITRLGFTLSGSMPRDSFLGTPLYIAPEIIAGQPPSAASDVYALGVILYQLIVGDLQRPLASGWERGVSDPLLREDIARATDGDTAQRAASVDELISLLSRLTGRREISDAQAKTAAGRRRRGTWLRLAAVALAGIVLPGAVATIDRNGGLESASIQENRRPVDVFYAEVMDVYRHYLFTDEELVSDPAAPAFRLQLNLAMYGEAPFTRSQIDEVGLVPNEIPSAMELLLLIRNNDLRITHILNDQESDRPSIHRQVERLRSRVKDTRDTAYALLVALHEREKQLGELPRPPD